MVIFRISGFGLFSSCFWVHIWSVTYYDGSFYYNHEGVIIALLFLVGKVGKELRLQMVLLFAYFYCHTNHDIMQRKLCLMLANHSSQPLNQSLIHSFEHLAYSTLYGQGVFGEKNASVCCKKYLVTAVAKSVWRFFSICISVFLLKSQPTKGICRAVLKEWRDPCSAISSALDRPRRHFTTIV